MTGRALLIMASGGLRTRTADGLRDRRVTVDVADDIDALLHAPDPPRPDVMVVDLDLGEADPLGACGVLRGHRAVLLALGEPSGRICAVEALRAGADDFVPHPPRPAELVARVRSLLRRLKEYCAAARSLTDLGEVIVDRERHVVTVRGESVALTPKEFELLSELARSPGDLVPREELLLNIWGFDESISSRTLDVHIGRLRKKVERDPSRPELIVTVPRVGYRIAA